MVAVAASASHFLTKVQNADAVAHTNMQIDRQSLKVYTRTLSLLMHHLCMRWKYSLLLGCIEPIDKYQYMANIYHVTKSGL